MSFRSSAAKNVGYGMPANSDQSRAFDAARRGHDGDAGGTGPSKRSTRLRISAAVSPAVTDVDDAAVPTYAQSQAQAYAQSQSQAQGQARRPPPSSFAQSSMNSNDQRYPENTQNASQKPILQTRRRQPSASNPKLPMGPRPQELLPSNTR